MKSFIGVFVKFLYQKFPILFFVIFALGFLFLQKSFIASRMIVQIPYSEFKKRLEQGEVGNLLITSRHITGELKGDPSHSKFITVRVDEKLAGKLDKYGVTYSESIETNFLQQVVSWVFPVIFFLVIWTFFMKRLQSKGGFGGGFMSIGKNKAKIYMESNTKINFDDVAGVDEAKEELKEIVDFLKDTKKYGYLGARMPKGVLLIGPPGTGKTLLAKAIAGEASVPFFSISGSEFVEMFVGVGAARVRDLFEQARKKSPCIIFIDELDALGRARSTSPLGGGHDEKEQTLNQLLVEMDGFDTSSGFILLAATNRPEILDPALLRAGRFDRQVLVDRPDRLGRAAILKVHMKNVKISEQIFPKDIAGISPGFTGADLANLVNEAALIATRRHAKNVSMHDFTNAVERIVAGLEKKNRLLNSKDRKVIAYHEMGHALVAATLATYDVVHKVSIIPRGIGALGYTIQRPTEDRFLMTKDELMNKMTVLLAGRAAEHLVFHHLSTGASDDLHKATDIARSMVTKYGMDEKLGDTAYEKEASSLLPTTFSQTTKSYSEETSREIDCAIRTFVEECRKYAEKILEDKKDTLHESAQLLLDKETLYEEDLKPYFKQMKT